MNWGAVRVLFLHEVRTLVRDRRAVFLAVVLPLVVTPLMLFAGKWTRERREQRLEQMTYRYAVTGSWADEARRLMAEARALAPADAPLHLQEIASADAESALRAGQLHFYLDTLTGAEADVRRARGDPNDEAAARERTRPAGVPVVVFCFQANRDASQNARNRVKDLLESARRKRAEQELLDEGFPVPAVRAFEAEDRSLATAAEVTGSRVGRHLTVLLLMLMLTGGATAAMDIIAGEKERGTLETLLTTAVARTEIVAAKQLVILAVALLITLIQVANILVYVTLRLVELPEDFVLEAPPATILALLLLFVPLAVMVSAVLLMVSGYARSYKEAQLYFLPVYLVSLVPALAATLPGADLRSPLVLVPVVNVSVAVREVMVGRHDWAFIGLAALVMMATAAAMVRAAASMLSKERLLTSAVQGVEEAGGPRLFPRRLLRWYVVCWALLFLGPGLLGLVSLRSQILFNQLVVFLAVPLFMVRFYRLPARTVLSLRRPPALAWLVVLLLIPAAHLVAAALFRIGSVVFPVPDQTLEEFSRAMMPEGMPAWELVLLLAVLPGLCEEIAFRGTLFYGMRARLPRLAAAGVVGAVFGLFHQDLFRILPTAFLGIVLCLIVEATGSIFPAMATHMGNNGFALWTAAAGLPVTGLEPPVYAAAALALALCLYLLYRLRDPRAATGAG